MVLAALVTSSTEGSLVANVANATETSTETSTEISTEGPLPPMATSTETKMYQVGAMSKR